MRPLAHSVAALSAVTAAPLLLGAMALRRDLRVGLRQRLGIIRSPGAGRVWVHGASVGEAQAALRHVDSQRANRRDLFATATSIVRG